MCVSCKKGNKLFLLWFSFAPKVSNFAPIRRPKLNPVTVPAQTQCSVLTRGLSWDFNFSFSSSIFFICLGRAFPFTKTFMVAEFNLGIDYCFQLEI